MPQSDSRVVCPFEQLFIRLHESHEVCVYEAVERLVHAGAEVGLEEGALLRMLDQGKSFEELLDLIQFKMGSEQKAA